uniref:Uncharacterized protein n=1 Tax=Thermorudis sp. TaxID=1969470 RepID=A0A7C3AQ28_9BACT
MSPEQLTVRVAWVRGTMQVEDAALFDEDLRVMLVDPISDILRVYEGQAFEVKVVDMPHLLIEKEALQDLARAIVPNPLIVNAGVVGLHALVLTAIC